MNESMKIVENGVVVTGDARGRAGNLTVLIKGDRIAEISNRGEMLKTLYPDAEIISALGKILLPGFVDAHLHGESFFLRHFTAMKPLARWPREPELKKIFDFVYRQAQHQDLSTMYRLAYFTALKSGVTTIGEFGFDHLDQPLSAAFETMRRADVRGIIGVHNGDQIERCRLLSHHSIRFALALPAEEDLTTYNLQSTFRAAATLKWPLLVHAGETKKGLEAVRRNFQTSLIELLRAHHLFEGKIMLMHCAALDPLDLDVLATARVHVVVTPRSIMAKETEAPQISEYLSRGIPIVLASDWGVSDPFDVMRSYIELLRSQGVDIPDGSALIRMVTFEAAKAVGVDDLAGSLEVGKKADITFVDVSGARFAGARSRDVNSLLSAFLQEFTSRDVSDVMINGEFFVRQGQVLTYSEEDLADEGEELMQRLSKHVPPGSIHSTRENRSHVENRAGSLRAIVADAHDFEDGFHIIPKKPAPVNAEKKVIPLQIEHTKKIELPGKIKKVFGEEDT